MQFVKSIPSVQLLILLINFHFSHINPDLYICRHINNIHLVVFPSHTNHLLQHLNVGIERLLKAAFKVQLNKFMTEYPEENPNS